MNTDKTADTDRATGACVAWRGQLSMTKHSSSAPLLDVLHFIHLSGLRFSLGRLKDLPSSMRHPLARGNGPFSQTANSESLQWTEPGEGEKYTV